MNDIEFEVSGPKSFLGKLEGGLNLINGVSGKSFGVKLKGYQGSKAIRTIDPIVLTALITASASCLSALIAGLLAIVSRSGGQEIEVTTKDGDSYRFPVNITSVKLGELLELIKQMDKPLIKALVQEENRNDETGKSSS